MPTEFRTALFADKTVGRQAVQFVLQHFRDDVRFIIVTSPDSEVRKAAIDMGFDAARILTHDALVSEEIQKKFLEEKISVIILAWWPYIVKSPWLTIPTQGIINFHPSYLPYNRGKNYNFWTLIEDTPFGVSLHAVDESIDGGDVLFQKRIEKSWTDNGETLYNKAQTAMFELFRDSYPDIRSGKYQRMKQDNTKGTFHYAKDMEAAAKIDLEKSYKARDLLNILRAKTFPPHPGAWFEEDGVRYEATITIRKI